MNNSYMKIYAPTELQESRYSPTVVTWPKDKADFNFKVEANTDYKRGAVAQAFHVHLANSCGLELITLKEEGILDRIVNIEEEA